MLFIACDIGLQGEKIYRFCLRCVVIQGKCNIKKQYDVVVSELKGFTSD